MFSARVPPLVPNRWSQAVAAHPPELDLTVSNPTRVNLPYPVDLLAPLAHPRGLVYRPAPAGLSEAREAVARLYRGQGLEVEPHQVLLTASTSESYALLAKLLCDPGEGFLVPQPSYPLFEHLLRAEGCRVFPYQLPEESGFHLDVARIDPVAGAKAVVVVQPNNPTGTVVPLEEWHALVDLCRERGWALIADEVFWDFPLGETPRRSFAGNPGCLTFTLGGLSKLLGLPQLKVGWVVASGPAAVVAEAFARLEFLADTFLSVATPTQQALPQLVELGWGLREAIRHRVQTNAQRLRRRVSGHPLLQLVPPDGGWSAVLRFPRVMTEEELVLGLLREAGVAVYPGYFFDFPHEGFLVVSLLVEDRVLEEGIGRLVEWLSARV